MSLLTSCELCSGFRATSGWIEVAADERLRVLRVLDAPDFPGFYRVVWKGHVAEFSDLSAVDREHVMVVVLRVERLLRQHLQPTKINLASLGNVVPHLHWHVIARSTRDSHFPQPVWGQRQREVSDALKAGWQSALDQVDTALKHTLVEV
jgi:diadenosine tetraphosphate (Ap4A) HIT family hydrolase